MKAPAEKLAYAASFDPGRKVPDGISVVDVDPASTSYSSIVGSTTAKCDGAIRFVLKNPGTDYFVQLHNEEVAEIFLEKLIAAIRGGEALKASETTAPKPAE